MPRFDNEGFNPKKRIDNDSRDRSVPTDENYYGGVPIDLDFNNRQSSNDIVRDRQNEQYNPNQYNTYNDELEPPVRSSRQQGINPADYGYSEEDEYSQGRDRSRSRERQHRQAPPVKRSKKPKKKIKGPKAVLIGIIAFILAIILLIVMLLNGVLGKINYDEHKDNEYVTSSELHSSPLVKNILLLGVDARSDEESETSRADSMMLISIDMKHKCIKMTSFLRDTWVYIPGHDGEQRLNAACSYGGYQGVVDTIEYNFGVDIDGYVVADFEMFKVLVDSIGGVEVEVTEKEAKEVTSHKKRYGNVKLEAGKHKLTGEQALAYCRIRKIDTDFQRTKRQRTVMTSILKEVKSSNPFTLYKMASNAAPYIETDLTKGQLKRTALCAVMCLSGDMVQTKVPFDGTWEYANIRGNSVITINKDKNKEQLIDYIYNKTAQEITAEQEEE
ncbi:MAG: LCP family protein [Eubacterium sp.]